MHYFSKRAQFKIYRVPPVPSRNWDLILTQPLLSIFNKSFPERQTTSDYLQFQISVKQFRSRYNTYVHQKQPVHAHTHTQPPPRTSAPTLLARRKFKLRHSTAIVPAQRRTQGRVYAPPSGAKFQNLYILPSSLISEINLPNSE